MPLAWVPYTDRAEAERRLNGIPAGLERVLLINGREATLERSLAPGDVLDLYPPLAGG